MSPDEIARLRSQITHAQTTCRCGHLLAACADCRGWLEIHASRIATAIEWWYIKAIELGQEPGTAWGSDAAEKDDLAYFMSWNGR